MRTNTEIVRATHCSILATMYISLKLTTHVPALFLAKTVSVKLSDLRSRRCGRLRRVTSTLCWLRR